MSSVSSVTEAYTPYGSIGIDGQEKLAQSPFIPKSIEGLVLPGSPFEAILKEVFQELATHEEDAMRLRSLSMEAERLWRKELLQKLGAEGVDAAQKKRADKLTSTFAHAVEPLPMVAAGVIALATACTGGGIALGAIALGAITVGALMALDTILGDPAKKALASTLGRGDSEKSQTWMNRIFLITGITSLACSVGLTAGIGAAAAGGLGNIIKIATSTAVSVSDVAARGAHVFTDRRVKLQTALVIELEEALRSSDRRLKEELSTLKQLEKSVKELFDTLETSMKSQMDCSSQIFAH